jgi:CHAT domain
MLVSHWAVNSAATVQLITHAVGATTRDKNLGRAEALRRAMLAMIDKGEPHEAHPALWAPFVVVGEGSAVAANRAVAPSVNAKRAPPKTKAGEGWAAELWKPRN